jgi:hypothetical protein
MSCIYSESRERYLFSCKYFGVFMIVELGKGQIQKIGEEKNLLAGVRVLDLSLNLQNLLINVCTSVIRHTQYASFPHIDARRLGCHESVGL